MAVRGSNSDLAVFIIDAMNDDMEPFNGKRLPSFMNSGGIRVDDFVGPGDITRYDVLRILPFGGNFSTVRLTGTCLFL